MLRIHFTDEDLARTRIAAGPDPMWETVLSLFRVRWSDAPLIFNRWRADAATRYDRSALRILMTLVPPGNFADFLTPADGELGLDAGIEAVLSTPRSRLRGNVESLGNGRMALPSWARLLAAGDVPTLKHVGRAVRAHHDAVIAPYWSDARAHVEADRAKRARAFVQGGCEAMLNSFRPMMRWEPPVLEVDFSVDRELHLNGRGLLMIPSYFSWNSPDTLMDPDLPPVLVYRVEHDLTSARDRDGAGELSLPALLGRTRAVVLSRIEDGCTSRELARRSGISAPSASQHTAVLREAGLIDTSRRGQAVVHTLTPLGAALLTGADHAGPFGRGQFADSPAPAKAG